VTQMSSPTERSTKPGMRLGGCDYRGILADSRFPQIFTRGTDAVTPRTESAKMVISCMLSISTIREQGFDEAR
jgi:hypothetical protein